MSYWVELQCDIKANGSNAYGEPGCFSHRNESIGVLVNSLSSASKMLKDMAIQRNWQKIRTGWCCPYCKHKYKRNEE